MEPVEIMEKLSEQHKNAECGLKYNTPFQLLIATVLSAQTTDKKVNQVTEKLFNEYPDIDSMMELTTDEIENKIRILGLYKNKSKNIYKIIRKLKDKYNSQVPADMKKLTDLPGVGRKTASVVLAEAFNIPAFPVDTHVYRVCRRIGLTDKSTPDGVSDNMMKILPEKMWIRTHHTLIAHGRNICTARNPVCSECSIEKYCKKIF